ncbi:MAG: IcmF1 [uncultured bacterium]|nr:MAG: IcmF1 [uncultured bacterium]
MKSQFLTKLLDNDIVIKSFFSFGVIATISILFWICSPNLIVDGHAPFAQPEKRLYVIIVLFLLWLLKVLIIDMDVPTPSIYSPAARKKLEALEKRFRGALRFMKKTTITRLGKTISLHQLPCYLFISPSHTGKTVLLANSNVHFILHRQFQTHSVQHLEPSTHCDWWITREASIIDVPAQYLDTPESNQWDYFLRLIKHHRGEQGITGLVITLPLPEYIKHDDTQFYHAFIKTTFQRLHEFQTYLSTSIPCYLLITKCDLIPGFAEYFAESGNDEIAQAWGLMLPQPKNSENIQQLFLARMNALIKKLNQQLLWRLHQERNPMTRPYIKDFPLQVECLKEWLLDFVKKFSEENFNFHLKGIYFTSAMQSKLEPENNVIDDSINATQRSLQLFKEPIPESRAFFIKQFITHALTQPQESYTSPAHSTNWKQYVAYAFSASIIGLAILTLGKDFKQGVRQTYSIQNHLSDYEVAVQQFHNPQEHLEKTILLLNNLHQAAQSNYTQFNLQTIFSFYTHKSKQKAAAVYQQALQNILLPEIKNYFAEAMSNPINKNPENIYAALKSYLMLGGVNQIDNQYIENALQTVFGNKMDEKIFNQLSYHLQLALANTIASQTLDVALIEQTRKHLFSQQPLQLAYIILKNINNNDTETTINLGTNIGKPPTFVSQLTLIQVPSMFTINEFQSTFTQKINTAAQEAIQGNWVLGQNPNNTAQDQVNALAEQLRTAYVTNYAQTWESLLDNIHLYSPDDLTQTDELIANIISNHSPLLQLLQTLHENTYFDPVATVSLKLQNLGMLVEKNHEAQQLLYQIFSSLEALHQQLQTIIHSDNSRKAAFDYITKRMLNPNNPDVITQVRMTADKSPEPLKSWLNNLSNNAWHFLLNDASKYLDLSWQEQVSKIYEAEVANHYPFNRNTNKEISIEKFTRFFGNPGIVTSFYNQYLQNLVDTSGADWRWKSLGDNKLPFENGTLRQIQQAMRIHRSFFPNGDNKLALQFTLQPYQFAKNIKSVKLNIDNKSFIDTKTSKSKTHIVTWPVRYKMTTIELTMTNQKSISREFPGEWGWFKLVNQSFESATSHKQMIVNFSLNNDSAKYILITDGQYNPFMSMNLNHFRLPHTLLPETT